MRIPLSDPFAPDNSYLFSYAGAGIVFATFLLLNGRITLGRVGTFFGEISYSLYLYHATFGTYTLIHLYTRIGFPAALAVALLLSFALATASWWFVERTSQRIARQLLRWRRQVQAPEPVVVSALAD